MALSFINEIPKPKFPHRKKQIFDSNLETIALQWLILPHFDEVCSAWYPNKTKKKRKTEPRLLKTNPYVST